MRLNWSMITGASLFMALMLVFLTLLGRVDGVLGDDAMRMVQATDLLNGQAWTDTTNYRDNTPFGAPMHWSRLIDAPLVGLMAVLRPFVGAQAPAMAAYIWPLFLLFGLFALVMALSDRLGGPAARIPVIALAMSALPIYVEFTPGRADHHSAQILLALALMLTTIAGRTDQRAALAAGIIGATCLAIGTESLPTLIVALGVFPLFWLADPVRGRRPASTFALSFAAASAVHLLIAMPWPTLFQPACDALSITYVVVAGLYAAGILLALLASPLSLALRLAALGGAGIVALTLAALLFPACLGGPYGDLDPLIAATLLTDISETQPVWTWWLNAEPRALSALILPIAGLVAAGLACRLTRGEKRVDWLILLAFSTMLVLATALQVRGVRFAILPALPAGAWLILLAWKRFQARQSLTTATVVALTCFFFAGTVHYVGALRLPVAASPVEAGMGLGQCLLPARYEKLAALPVGRIISSLIIGPHILYTTPHSVVSAGYHRNGQGLKDAMRFFSGDEAEALEVVRERGLNYYVFCNGISAEFGLHGLAPFRPVDAQGKLWPWLRPLSEPTDAIQIYAITQPA